MQSHFARRFVAAAVAIAMTTTPLAQNAPAPAKAPAQSVVTTPPGGFWNQLPAEQDLPGIPRPSDNALRGPEFNGVAEGADLGWNLLHVARRKGGYVGRLARVGRRWVNNLSLEACPAFPKPYGASSVPSRKGFS